MVRIPKRCGVAQSRVSPDDGLQFTLVLSTQDTRIACGGGLPTHFFVAPGQHERSWRKKRGKKANDQAANLGFEAKLWLAADKLRNNMDAAEYKHVVFELMFLKYISDGFEEMHQTLVAGEGGAVQMAEAVPEPASIMRDGLARFWNACTRRGELARSQRESAERLIRSGRRSPL